VLSRFAGAAQELDGALLVNPYDLDQMADAMHQALVMPPEERRARWMGMMAKLERATAQSWSREFQRALERQAAARAGGATGAAVLGARGAGAKASQS
jgi:trehalose 6-phosphate synthase